MSLTTGNTHKMKQQIIAAVAVLAFWQAGQPAVLRGRVADGNRQPVEFATVVALADSIQRGGTVTDSLGRYELSLPEGRYVLKFSSVGYASCDTTVDVSGSGQRVDVTMPLSGVLMNTVEVEASAIRREPDRYVMQVEDMQSMIGKDGKEMLQQAPGVWIDDEKVTVNGKSGTKIYVNDRELKMNDEQLVAFLNSLKAEDVSKVEVIPQTGAEYSADTSAGIIRITMKKNRADGVMGNVAMASEIGRNVISLRPSGALNVKDGKWNYNLNVNWFANPKSVMELQENNRYATGSLYDSDSRQDAQGMMFGNVMASVFYDLDNRNTFGLEFGYNLMKRPVDAVSNSRMDLTDDRVEQIAGDYRSTGKNNNYDLTFNYVHRLDTLGSTLKVIANSSWTDETQDADNRTITTVGTLTDDSLSRSTEHSLYRVTNISLDWDEKIGKNWSVGAGGKYTFNRMDNRAFFEYAVPDGLWIPETGRNYDDIYKENIAALYAKASGRFGPLSAVVGLRGEYTWAHSRGSVVANNYFDLFPNANLSWLIDKTGANSLTLSYSRHITRPSFWALNPIRRQISDYSYQTGNPRLKPAYQHTLSLTAVYKYRYTLSAWIDFAQNPIRQAATVDPIDPNIVVMSMVNSDTEHSYGATLSLPFRFFDCWDLTLNTTYFGIRQRMMAGGPVEYNNTVTAMGNTGVQLPLDFYVSCTAFWQSGISISNMHVGAMTFLNLSIKKSFAKKRWTLSVDANNLLGSDMRLRVETEAYHNETVANLRPSFGVSLAYNFNVGDMFRARAIESNADKSRQQQKESAY